MMYFRDVRDVGFLGPVFRQLCVFFCGCVGRVTFGFAVSSVWLFAFSSVLYRTGCESGVPQGWKTACIRSGVVVGLIEMQSWRK